MQATMEDRNDCNKNDDILTKLSADLAWRIVGGPDRPTAAEVAAEIKALCKQWADGEREVCALTAEDFSAVAAMAIRRQL